MSDSLKISLLTILISGAAAVLFPVKEDPGDDMPSGASCEEVTEHDS